MDKTKKNQPKSSDKNDKMTSRSGQFFVRILLVLRIFDFLVLNFRDTVIWKSLLFAITFFAYLLAVPPFNNLQHLSDNPSRLLTGFSVFPNPFQVNTDQQNFWHLFWQYRTKGCRESIYDGVPCFYDLVLWILQLKMDINYQISFFIILMMASSILSRVFDIHRENWR